MRAASLRRSGGSKRKAEGGVEAVAVDRLRSFIERIERLNEEKDALTNDIREVFAEAKGEGFDTKTMRQVIRLRKMDTAEVQEQEALLDVYRRALGMDGAAADDGE